MIQNSCLTSSNRNSHLPLSFSVSNQLTGVGAGPSNVISYRCFCSSTEDTSNFTHDLDSDGEPVYYIALMALSNT